MTFVIHSFILSLAQNVVPYLKIFLVKTNNYNKALQNFNTYTCYVGNKCVTQLPIC